MAKTCLYLINVTKFKKILAIFLDIMYYIKGVFAWLVYYLEKRVPVMEFQRKSFYDINDLLEIMRILRSDNGCPWDREQTHSSLKKDFIEEVYEAVEAIDLNDTELLKEELGDVLLQIVFHCQIERELDSFSFDDVCNEVCQKLIVRHPHVFSDVNVENSEDVMKNWDAIKKETKGQETYAETLKSVAKSLPALMRAQKIGKRAMRAGMDFKDAWDTVECTAQELEELKEAVNKGDADNIKEEIGDLLFSCVNIARHLGVDAEEALTESTEKFVSRFEKVENLLRLKGIDMKSLGIDELDAYWHEVKKTENN